MLKIMISPFTLISFPIIFIVSLGAAFLLAPEIDPALTLAPDIPIERYHIIDFSSDAWIAEAYQSLFLSYHKGGVGYFTGNFVYPYLDIKSLQGIPILTKNYVGIRGDLMYVLEQSPIYDKPRLDYYQGLIAEEYASAPVSFPSWLKGDYYRTFVYHFKSIREIYTNSQMSAEEIFIVDWYCSWKDNPSYYYLKQLFVHPDDPGNGDLPLCLKIVNWVDVEYRSGYRGVRCMYASPDGTLTPALSFHNDWGVYSTINSWETLGDPLDLRICGNLESMGRHADLSFEEMVTIFSQIMVHPIPEVGHQDLLFLKPSISAQNYTDFDPGPLLDSNGDVADDSNGRKSSLGIVLIFTACALTLGFCAYSIYSYFG